MGAEAPVKTVTGSNRGQPAVGAAGVGAEGFSVGLLSVRLWTRCLGAREWHPQGEGGWDPRPWPAWAWMWGTPPGTLLHPLTSCRKPMR